MKSEQHWFFISFMGILLSFLALPGLTLAGERNLTDFEEILKETNAELSSFHQFKACPGIKLALLCGNGKCERDAGENEENCPSDCYNLPIRSYNWQTICSDVKEVFEPQNSEEALQAIQFAHERHLKIKVVGTLHSANSLICTDGIVISSEKLKKIRGIEMFNGEETVVVEPGVKLGDLSEWLHERGKSLGYALIGYRGASIGGVIATGSRGDSPVHPVVTASLVRAFRLISAEGEVKDFSEADTSGEVFKALRTHLGLLGFIVEVRLKIFPQFNLKIQNSIHSVKELFKKDGISSVIDSCDYGQIRWFPHTGKFQKTCGIETTENADPGATSNLLNPNFPEFSIKPARLVFQYASCHQKINCLLERLRLAMLALQPPFLKLNRHGKLVSAKQLVGYSHRMISSELSPLANNFHETEWEIAVPLSKADAALNAIRDLLSSTSVCMPFSGITLRYAPVTDTTLLALPSAGGEFKLGEPAVFFDFVAYEPFGFPSDLLEHYKSPYQEIAEILINQFDGRAHWGKNEDYFFELQRKKGVFRGVMNAFRQIADIFDPKGMFSNAFAVQAGLRNASIDTK